MLRRGRVLGAGVGGDVAPPFLRDGSDLGRAIWRLAWPVISENLLITLLFVVDTWMVTRLGSVALAASGLGGVILWRVFMMTGCIDRGVAAMVARAVGEGNGERATRAAAQGLLCALLIGVPVTVVGFVLSGSFLRWIGGSAEVVLAGTIFLQVILLSSCARLVQVVGAGIMRAAGDTKSPMWIMVVTNIVNLFLNWVLIFGKLGFPALGLMGSGIATSVAVLGAAIFTVVVLCRRSPIFQFRMRHFSPDLHRLRVLLRLSVPVLFDEIMVSVGFLSFYAMINMFGTDALAAHTIAVRVEGFSFNVGAGFLVAGATLTGQALGAYGAKEAQMAVFAVMRRAFFTLSSIAVVLMVFPSFLVGVFRPSEVVNDLGVPTLILFAMAQPFMAISYVFNGSLRGAGDTFTPMVVSAVTNLFLRVGLCWFMAWPCGLGLWGLYIAVAIEWAIRSVILYFVFMRGRWKTVSVT